MVRIAVLVSGGGTNLQALIDAQSRGELKNGRIAAVLSSRPDAYALERAARAGIPGYVVARKDFASNREMTIALVDKLRELNIGLVVLAGFLHILTGEMVAAFPNAILNVHPALIPSFCGAGYYGLHVHEAALAYARDFMIDKGFTFCIPPFMIHGNVVEGVMSQTEMDAMMYKIEGEDLYLIGTSEHSMIGKFIDQIIPEDKLPQTLTSYSPCFRKEKGAHGIEERGVYRIHQFEKQEMVVVCRPEESMDWYEKMWRWSVELFRSLDIPVRQLECCSGDLADLKVKSCDIEAWSPRQQKYFEVCSCSNLGDAQARRLKMRVKGENGTYLPHTLNNTVVAPPRMLIAFLENNLQADGSVKIPAALRPYMGGKEVLTPKQ